MPETVSDFNHTAKCLLCLDEGVVYVLDHVDDEGKSIYEVIHCPRGCWHRIWGPHAD